MNTSRSIIRNDKNMCWEIHEEEVLYTALRGSDVLQSHFPLIDLECVLSMWLTGRVETSLLKWYGI